MTATAPTRRTPGPPGSDVIENVFLNYFASKYSATDPTAFDGRSDYGPFIDQGIPAGGLFSGAEGIKTAAEVTIYGGTAGVALDPCYHQACDTFAQQQQQSLDELGDAAAHSVVAFAFAGPDVIPVRGRMRELRNVWRHLHFSIAVLACRSNILPLERTLRPWRSQSWPPRC